MKQIPICVLAFFSLLSSAFAQQAPWGRADVPISSRDRVYAADQTSNTVSVIDPFANKLLGVIRLGDPVPGALSALYKGQLLVHGLGYSPDSKTLAVVSIASNSVTLIDTATNKVNGIVYLGRSPHEAFFTPNGRELWVTVRGEDYVSVIDPKGMREIRHVHMANGPGMTMFGLLELHSGTGGGRHGITSDYQTGVADQSLLSQHCCKSGKRRSLDNAQRCRQSPGVQSEPTIRTTCATRYRTDYEPRELCE
jgi:YVTN family beta-propeller protein